MDIAQDATPLASTTPSEATEPETRDPRRCNTMRRRCSNPPMPGEFYCFDDLHPRRMRPHAEKAVETATGQLAFLSVNISEAEFAPAAQLLHRSQIARDAERWHDAFRFARQATEKALQIKVSPIVSEVKNLWDEYGFLEPRFQADFDSVMKEAQLPRPNWNQLSVKATKLRNLLGAVKATTERNRQRREEEAEQLRTRQADNKRLRAERDEADRLEREARAAQALENVGDTGNTNTGALSAEENRKVEAFATTPAPGAGKHQKTKSSKDAKKKTSKGKKIAA